MFISGQIKELFNEVDSVLLRSGQPDITVVHSIVLEHSQEGGLHRVSLMDALRTAVNGHETQTPMESAKDQPWYSDTNKFLEVAAMAVSNYQRN